MVLASILYEEEKNVINALTTLNTCYNVAAKRDSRTHYFYWPDETRCYLKTSKTKFEYGRSGGGTNCVWNSNRSINFARRKRSFLNCKS